MVEQNIASALILEDDADWDIRIKSQMRNFARASRLLVQPLPNSTDAFLDPTYARPSPGQDPPDLDINNHSTGEPSTSPYGDIDRWDLLWLGHCGCLFPRASDEIVSLGRAIIPNDETVPEPHQLNMQFGDGALVTQYPAHTRIVSRASVNTCSLGYGISLPGARRILYELALHKMTGPTDMMHRSVCEGSEGRPLRICLTVQPQLFQHHRPVGPRSSFSEISDQGDEYNKRAHTLNVRWSIRLNFPKLVDGQTDYIDLYRDSVKLGNSTGS
jgi:hypothetical protein